MYFLTTLGEVQKSPNQNNTIENGVLKSYISQFQTKVTWEWAQVRTEVRSGFQTRGQNSTLKNNFLEQPHYSNTQDILL